MSDTDNVSSLSGMGLVWDVGACQGANSNIGSGIDTDRTRAEEAMREAIPADTIRVTYRIETRGEVAAMARKIAADQSTGTFVAVPGETPALKARVAAEVVAIRPLESVDEPSFGRDEISMARSDHGRQGEVWRRGEVDIDFPLEAIGTDLVALTTIVIGGVFSIAGLGGIRITDLRLPPAFGEAHPGPQFGTAGTRRLTGVAGRPIIGSIVKPALGLRPDESAALVAELCAAGVDFIKDDEKLASPAYARLEDRVAAIMPVIADHEQRSGKKVMYAFNIAADDPEEMLRRHDIVAAAGGNAAVLPIQSLGFGALAFLRKRSRLVLHGHRAGWDLLTRHPGFGLDFSVYQQFWRLLGIDQFQINGIGSKYWESDASFLRSFAAVTTPLFRPEDCALPVVCSGQWGGQAPATFAGTGGSIDLLYLCGGGIVGHPGGAAAGVAAVRQAWEASMLGIALDDYARDRPALAAALATFGASSADA